MPLEVWALRVAERFHRFPWELDSEPAEEVVRLRWLLGLEAEVLNAARGLPDDEPLYLEDDDGLPAVLDAPGAG